jgi:hypothetical protein
MAKTRSIIQISGKLEDKVYVQNRYGSHVRTAPEKGVKKNEPALKAQYSSTSFFNTVASQINKALRAQVYNFIDARFYQQLLKKFRTVKDHGGHRWLLVREVMGMEGNALYPLDKMGFINWQVQPLRRKIRVILDVYGHPPNKVEKHRVDRYYYELLLLCWNKTKKPPVMVTTETDWIDIKGGLPLFEIPMQPPAGTTHWLLFIHGRLANNRECLDIRIAEGLQCVAVGSFNKKEMALAEKRMAGRTISGTTSPRTVKKEGVKAKVVR